MTGPLTDWLLIMAWCLTWCMLDWRRLSECRETHMVVGTRCLGRDPCRCWVLPLGWWHQAGRQWSGASHGRHGREQLVENIGQSCIESMKWPFQVDLGTPIHLFTTVTPVAGQCTGCFCLLFFCGAYSSPHYPVLMGFYANRSCQVTETYNSHSHLSSV